MDDLFIPLTDLFVLVALNYIALKIRHLSVLETHELLTAPLLTGLAVIWMILQPGLGDLLHPDLRYAPVVMAGLRYGWTISILSTVLPAAYSYFMNESNFAFALVHGLLLPAIVSSIFHRKEYRSGYTKLKLQDGLKICVLLFTLRLLNVAHLTTENIESPAWLGNQLFSLAVSVTAITVLIAMFNMENKNWLLQRKLEMQANQDGLTRLPNFRSFMNIADSTLQRKCVSILMIDIDNFKNYNDCLGHIQGDNLLREVGQVLRHSIGEQDYIARYGGEEFIVMCCTNDRKRLVALAEKMRHEIATYPFLGREVQPNRHISISIGVSTAKKTNDDLQRIIAEADQALYISKNAGKNQYSFYEDIRYAKTNNT